jgi:cell division protease FtsH
MTVEFSSRPRDSERPTRKPLEFWDRVKLIFLFVGAWLVLLWAALAQFDPAISPNEAFNQTMRSYWWLLVLAGLEFVRQVHYLISEHSPRYHQRWTGFFAAVDKRTGRMNDWTRYRLARVLKALFVLVIIDLALAKIYHLPPATAWIQLPITITKSLPIALQFAAGSLLFMLQFVLLFWFLSRGGVDVYMPDDINTRFSDVWGQDNVLAKVRENLVFLEDPESIEARGGYVPRGILLWGPPGTGKTLMAKSVAGETAKPFVFIDPGAFQNMFVGVGVLKVKGLFRKLRRLAVRYGGVIAFFDEADSLGNRGAGVAQGPWGGMMSPSPWSALPQCNGLSYLSPDTATVLFRSSLQPSTVAQPGVKVRDRIIAGMGGMGGNFGTLPALLSELSGLEKPRGFFNRILRRAIGMRPKPPPKYRILVMMATNLPDALDPALLRPGRIDRIYKVGYPSKEGRLRTYRGYFGKVQHELTEADIDKLATITPYFSGASIEDLVNQALIQAITDGRDGITWRDVIRAKQLKELGPPEDVEYVERERHAVAIHEACHAVVAFRAKHHLNIDIATIEKGGSYLGMVAYIPPEDQFTRWRTEYEADIMSSLASLAGERMFFEGDSSSGVSSDLETATRLATLMEGYWGMGTTVTSHGVTHEVGIGGGGRPGAGGEVKDRSLLENNLGSRIEGKLTDLLERTEALLKENRRVVFAVAHALESNKTVTGEDVAAVIEGVPGALIDGRAYHTEEFVEQAEAYHREALAAHKGHAQIGMPLPVVEPAVRGEGDGDGDVPGRPDITGNGDARRARAIGDGDGSGTVEAGAGPAGAEPVGEGEIEE